MNFQNLISLTINIRFVIRKTTPFLPFLSGTFTAGNTNMNIFVWVILNQKG